MSRFRDIYLDDCVPGYPCQSSPRFSTRMPTVDSGAEGVNQRWETPLYRFRLPQAVRQHAVFESLRDHWMIMRGPAFTFPFRDPLDFASVALVHPNEVPTISGTDQELGVSDGANQFYQLQKTYVRSLFTMVRPIYHPIVSTVVVTVDDSDPATFLPPMAYTVDRNTGIVTITPAPPPGRVVKAGFLFDVEVRFESDDSFDGILQNFHASGFADLTLVEVRPCD